MSAYHQFETELSDGDCIVAALKDMKFSPIVHEKPVQLMGYEGRRRKETAEIVIPRKQVGLAANDIGFKKEESGRYRVIVSQYDQHQGYNESWRKQLKQRYAEHRAMKLARRKGLKLKKREELTDAKTGKKSVRLVFAHRRMA